MPDAMQTLDLPAGSLAWRTVGAGPPLVMLHGWSMSHAVFDEFAGLLKNDFQLLIPDLPGHGVSGAVDPCTLRGLAAQMADWLETLRLGQVNLLGWSLGGQVAQHLADDAPQLIHRLILVASTPRFCVTDGWSAGLPAGELRALKRGLKQRYLATMGEFFDSQFEPGEISAQRRRDILQFAVRPAGLPEPEDAIKGLELLGQEDLRDGLGRIMAPTLVIHGEKDRIIPFAAGLYMADRIKSSRLVRLEDAGHAPFLSRPAFCVDMIREFVRDFE